jgi:hypothetical protein
MMVDILTDNPLIQCLALFADGSRCPKRMAGPSRLCHYHTAQERYVAFDGMALAMLDPEDPRRILDLSHGKEDGYRVINASPNPRDRIVPTPKPWTEE